VSLNDSEIAVRSQCYAGPIPKFFGTEESVTRSRTEWSDSEKASHCLDEGRWVQIVCVRTVLADD
jgi:hypothetical protein